MIVHIKNVLRFKFNIFQKRNVHFVIGLKAEIIKYFSEAVLNTLKLAVY